MKRWMRFLERAKRAEGSGDGDEGLERTVEHLLVETSDGVFGEVRGGAVVLGGGFVTILLVDDDGVGIAVDGVRNVADTTFFLAREAGKLAEDLNNFLAIITAEVHTDGEADHKFLLADFSRVRPGTEGGVCF